MKKLILSLMVVSTVFASAAFADGFVCQTREGDLNIRAYNNVQPSAGTRVSAAMILSDPRVAGGRKTIARFTDINETLSNVGATYSANVDHRFNDSGRKGELISGTKLGELKEIELDVQFSYARPVPAGSYMPARLTLVKRNGQEIARQVLCVRYLKQ